MIAAVNVGMVKKKSQPKKGKGVEISTQTNFEIWTSDEGEAPEPQPMASSVVSADGDHQNVDSLQGFPSRGEGGSNSKGKQVGDGTGNPNPTEDTLIQRGKGSNSEGQLENSGTKKWADSVEEEGRTSREVSEVLKDFPPLPSKTAMVEDLVKVVLGDVNPATLPPPKRPWTEIVQGNRDTSEWVETQICSS